MMEKTNVMRILDRNHISYKSYCYKDTNAISGIEVAEVLHENPEQVLKTLVTISKEKKIYVRYFNKPRIDNYLRITIGTDDEMDRLFKALEEIVK